MINSISWCKNKMQDKQFQVQNIWQNAIVVLQFPRLSDKCYLTDIFWVEERSIEIKYMGYKNMSQPPNSTLG